MKRLGNVWEELCQYHTLQTAILKAAKGKRKSCRAYKTKRGEKRVTIQDVLDDIDTHTIVLQRIVNRYKVGEYEKMVVHGADKDRLINKLPFFPDRCIQWAIALVMHQRWTKSLTAHTFASWKHRGINSKKKIYNLNHQIRRAINSFPKKTQVYVLVLDVKKCYDSVDNKIMMRVVRKYCKDKKMLDLCSKFCFSMEGLPIGSYLSQLWINLYLSELDRYAKETVKVQWYFRYMDNVVVISDDKHYLHQVLWRFRNFLWYSLHLELNSMRQVFPLSSKKGIGRALDSVGYVFYRHHEQIRKRIKVSYKRKKDVEKSVTSYHGLLKNCNARNLIVKCEGEEVKNEVFNVNLNKLEAMRMRELKYKKVVRPFEGEAVKIDKILNRKLTVLNWQQFDSKQHPGEKYFKIQFKEKGKLKVVMTSAYAVTHFLSQLDPKVVAPLQDFELRHDNNGYYVKGTLENEPDDDDFEEEEED